MRRGGIPIGRVVRALERITAGVEEPVVGKLARARRRDPFRILISCLLSLRTKDGTTREASTRLFALAGTPQGMLALSRARIRKAIYPVGFYRTKAQRIHEICRGMLVHFHGRVPDTMEALLSLKGVGRKTANLVLILGFGKDGMCVDTHVHRISNRLGFVRTKTPLDTEWALREALPKRYWPRWNDLLVRFGQAVCQPVSPWCSSCGIRPLCARRGVGRSR